MPWTTEDVDKHKKGLSDKQKETWVKIANAALKKCQAEGGENCEASAIKQASAVTGSMKEYRAYMTSTNNVLVAVNGIDIDGEQVPIAELVAVWQGGVDKLGEAVDVAKVQAILAQVIKMLGGEEEKPPEKKPAEEMAEAELSESASGHALGLAEASQVDIGPRAPLVMEVAIIRPGFGNKRDNHYYPQETLARDAHVFKGIKMYTTDHRESEKSVRTEVAVIKDCPVRFTSDGAPVATVAVHDGDFAEQARNRAKLGTLESLECSILASGNIKRGEIGGKAANIVEAITKAMSVDFVTKAGAGGHALNLAENSNGGEQMGDENKDQEPSKVVEETTAEVTLAEKKEETPKKLEEAEVKRLLAESKLPAASKKRLEGEYEDETALREAILAEVEYVQKLTGSGAVFGQGSTIQAVIIEPLDKRLAEIDQRYGVRR